MGSDLAFCLNTETEDSGWHATCPTSAGLQLFKTPKLIAINAYPSGGNAQFGSKPSKGNRLLGFEQPVAARGNSATGKPASTKNLNNLLADDDKDTQGEQLGLIQQLLNFFFSKLWSPSTNDAEKLGLELQVFKALLKPRCTARH